MLYCGISLNVHGAATSGDLLLTKKQVDETVRNKVKLEEDLQRSNIALTPPPQSPPPTHNFIVVTQAKVAVLLWFSSRRIQCHPPQTIC